MVALSWVGTRPAPTFAYIREFRKNDNFYWNDRQRKGNSQQRFACLAAWDLVSSSLKIMKAAKQHIHGKLITENGRSALLLLDEEPTAKTEDSLYLRYAVVVRGPDDHVLPAILLDDWGKEIRGLKIFKFLREHGDEFPRAEIFGFDMDGSETQLFVRSLELYSRLPAYAYADVGSPLDEGVLLDAILLLDSETDRVVRLEKARESGVKRPLRSAHVSWWRIPASTITFDFSLLEIAG